MEKKSRWMKRFVAVFFIGYFLLFTSSIWMEWMHIEENLIAATPLYEPKVINEREITLYRWNYCEKEKKMEIELEINNHTIDNQDTYEFVAKTRKGKQIKVVSMISQTNYVVLHLQQVPKNWNEISLKMAIAGKDPFTSFYTNRKEVERVSQIRDLDPKAYEVRHLQDTKRYCEHSIKKEKEWIAKGDMELTSYQESLDLMKKEEEFQTEEQISVTEGKIAAVNGEMDAIRKSQEESRKKVEELEKRIQLTDKKMKATQGE